MATEINFQLKTISFTTSYDIHSLNCIATLVFEYSDGNYYFLKDDIEKLRDVSSMPDYIRNDWINYNKKELTILESDYQIKIIQHELRHEVGKSQEKLIEYLESLKIIKRDLIIKKYL